MSRGVGFEGVALLDLSTAAWDMHFGFADFHVRKLDSDLLQDRIVGFTGLAGGQAVCDDRCRRICKFLIIVIPHVLNGSRHKVVKSKVRKSERLEDFPTFRLYDDGLVQL